MTQNFPNLMKTIHLQIQECQWTQAQQKWRKPTLSHIISKLLKINNKDKIVNVARKDGGGGRRTCYIQRNIDKDYSRFLVENNASEKAVEQHL